jgi:hypothetical protein
VNRRIVIDRLDLDLRGVDPEVARQAVRLLGPALRAALPAADHQPLPRERPDAGAVAATGDAADLAAALAGRIAGQISGRIGGRTGGRIGDAAQEP